MKENTLSKPCQIDHARKAMRLIGRIRNAALWSQSTSSGTDGKTTVKIFLTPSRPKMMPEAKMRLRTKPDFRPQGQPMFGEQKHHKPQGREVKNRRGFLPERLRHIECEISLTRPTKATGRPIHQESRKTPAKCRFDMGTIENEERLSTKVSFCENQMCQRRNKGQGQDKSGTPQQMSW